LIIKIPKQVLNLQESCGLTTYYTQFSGCDSEQRTLINVTDSGIYNLQEACERFFANTGVQPADLLYQSKKKRLKLIRIGGEPLVTAEAIYEMIMVCQERKAPQGSGSKGERAGNPFGASSTEDAKLALAALNQTIREQKENSKHTSQENVKHPVRKKAGKALIADVLRFYAEIQIPKLAVPNWELYRVQKLAEFWGLLSLADVNGERCREYVRWRKSQGVGPSARRELEVLQLQ
jgi:hypothetical protein